jgi:hypothetical protein
MSGDVVTELAGGGVDTIRPDITYTLSANVENLEIQGGAALNGTGNADNNTLRGGAGANTLKWLGWQRYYCMVAAVTIF